MANNQRPRFEPSHDHLNSYLLADGWSALLSCPAGFSQDIFELGTTQLVHHPEYNSTLILRSEIISDLAFQDGGPGVDLPPLVPTFFGLRPVRCIHRKLLPRRPGRDAALEQYCTFYTSSSPSDGGQSESPNTLVLTPIVEDGTPLPYYHPAVSHIAFRFLSFPSAPDVPSVITPSPPQTILRIDALPLLGVSLNPNDRLYRTSLALLETAYRYCWGAITQYKKRVVHDALVPRERYQDLYLVMRERHKGLVDTWKEVTDPLKHVFEDIGIATYLMLLWKDTFSRQTSEHSPSNEDEDLTKEPWKNWPRPPGGFLDLGCGNGLLTHILTTEGYEGVGIDLRARMSWEGYPAETRAALLVAAVDPTRMFDTDVENQGTEGDSREHHISSESCSPDTSTSLPLSTPTDVIPDVPTVQIAAGSFIVANHADELTPWTPVLATLSGAAGYLSIPCCAWAFDARFQRGKGSAFPSAAVDGKVNQAQSTAGEHTPLASVTPTSSCATEKEREQQEKEAGEAFIETLNLGGDGSGNSHKSAYSQYRIWLARLSAHCGWEIECETLRIPSTRAWAVVGRRRTGNARNQEKAMANARAIVDDVKRRALFQTRRPEGKAGDH